MELVQGISNIRKILVDTNHTPEEKLKKIEFYLPNKDYDYVFCSSKDLLLKFAIDSGAKRFKLVATMNSNIGIFQWCDQEYNFLGLCPPDYAKKSKVVYTLKQLPSVIDNAEEWLRSVKENPHMSGSPYFVSDLQLMSL